MMKLICIFLAATLAVAAAKPYGVKGGYDRDNDRLVQTHIPVNEDFNADRQEISQTRKIGRPGRPGGYEPSVVEPIGGAYRDREPLIQGRPIGGGYGDHGRNIEVVRPIGGGHDHGQISEVGRPIGGGYGDHGRVIEVVRPIGGGHDHGQISEVGRPIGGGYSDHGRVIEVGRPNRGGHDHGGVIEIGRPNSGGYNSRVTEARPISGIHGYNSHLEAEELGGGVQRVQQIGGIKGQRQTGY